MQNYTTRPIKLSRVSVLFGVEMKRLRDIVNNYIMPAHMHNGIDKQAEAEQAIKALLLSKLPEKKYVSEDEDPAKAYDDLVHQGYNQAIDEITKTIEGL